VKSNEDSGAKAPIDAFVKSRYKDLQGLLARMVCSGRNKDFPAANILF
jgi:hypothetical protein